MCAARFSFFNYSIGPLELSSIELLVLISDEFSDEFSDELSDDVSEMGELLLCGAGVGFFFLPHAPKTSAEQQRAREIAKVNSFFIKAS